MFARRSAARSMANADRDEAAALVMVRCRPIAPQEPAQAGQARLAPPTLPASSPGSGAARSVRRPNSTLVRLPAPIAKALRSESSPPPTLGMAERVRHILLGSRPRPKGNRRPVRKSQPAGEGTAGLRGSPPGLASSRRRKSNDTESLALDVQTGTAPRPEHPGPRESSSSIRERSREGGQACLGTRSQQPFRNIRRPGWRRLANRAQTGTAVPADCRVEILRWSARRFPLRDLDLDSPPLPCVTGDHATPREHDLSPRRAPDLSPGHDG